MFVAWKRSSDMVHDLQKEMDLFNKTLESLEKWEKFNLEDAAMLFEKAEEHYQSFCFFIMHERADNELGALRYLIFNFKALLLVAYAHRYRYYHLRLHKRLMFYENRKKELISDERVKKKKLFEWLLVLLLKPTLVFFVFVYCYHFKGMPWLKIT